MSEDLKHMQPLSEFVEHYVKGQWQERDEFVIYNHPHHRFRITVETPDMSTVSEGFIGIWRDEKLMDAGVNVNCDDAKEFAQALLNSLFYHLSPHETMHIIDALEADLKKWDAERAELLAGSTEPLRCPH